MSLARFSQTTSRKYEVCAAQTTSCGRVPAISPSRTTSTGRRRQNAVASTGIKVDRYFLQVKESVRLRLDLRSVVLFSELKLWFVGVRPEQFLVFRSCVWFVEVRSSTSIKLNSGNLNLVEVTPIRLTWPLQGGAVKSLGGPQGAEGGRRRRHQLSRRRPKLRTQARWRSSSGNGRQRTSKWTSGPGSRVGSTCRPTSGALFSAPRPCSSPSKTGWMPTNFFSAALAIVSLSFETPSERLATWADASLLLAIPGVNTTATT